MNQQATPHAHRDAKPALSPSPSQPLAPVAAVVTTWVIGIYVALVLNSPYWNDDIVDENLRSTLRASHTNLFSYIWHQTSAFVHIDARFDPGTLAWTYSVFDVFDNRASYKLVIGLLLALAIAAAALCIRAIASNWALAATFVLIVAGVLQVRLWADGITSFAGLMTLTTALILGSLYLLATKHGVGWVILAGLLYLSALFTYEYVFAFAPAMIVIVLALGRGWRPVAAIAAPAVLTLLISASLHLFVHAHPAAEYTLRLQAGAIITTFAKQLAAALPLSQWWLGHYPGLPPIAGTLIAVCAVLLGIPISWTMYRLSSHLPQQPSRAAGLYALLGVSMWFAPAALVSLTKRWQESMPWGQGYIPVVYEYFGLALCLLALWMFVDGRLGSRNEARKLETWRLGSATIIGLLATVTMAANLSLMP